MKILLSTVLLISLVFLPNANALAHEGQPHGEGEAWRHWNLLPDLLVIFVATGGLYAAGVRKLWRKSAAGMGVSHRHIATFSVGLLALAAALISPVDALAAASLSWHMVQHLLIILVVAPLLILGNPMLAFLSAFPVPMLQKGGRWWNRRTNLKRVFKSFAYPLVVWGIHAAVVTLWHVPALYQSALRVEWIHDLEHLSFLLAALLFWWLVLPRRGAAHYPGHGVAVLILFTTMLQGGLLGALLTFSENLWYPIYREASRAGFGTALDDQNLAGILMWIPPGLVYMGVALGILAKMLNPDEGYRGRRQEGYKES